MFQKKGKCLMNYKSFTDIHLKGSMEEDDQVYF